MLLKRSEPKKQRRAFKKMLYRFMTPKVGPNMLHPPSNNVVSKYAGTYKLKRKKYFEETWVALIHEMVQK